MSQPIGTPVTVTGASRRGTMVASSWLTMQTRRETIPTPARTTTSLSNGVGDLAKELADMRATSAFSRVAIVNGTRPFQPNLPTAIIG